MSGKKNKTTIHTPRISFDQIGHRWIRYKGQAYNVATCPPDIFLQALKEYYEEHPKDRLDSEVRWFLVCYTTIPVYTSASLDDKTSA